MNRTLLSADFELLNEYQNDKPLKIGFSTHLLMNKNNEIGFLEKNDIITIRNSEAKRQTQLFQGGNHNH